MNASGFAILQCLFFHGPTWDGDIPSKHERSDLIDLGLVERWNGWQWLTAAGVRFAIEALGLDREKEKWQRERSEAVHQMRHPEDS